MYQLTGDNADLDRFRSASPDLAEELALCRWLAQRAAERSPALAATLLSTAAKLSKELHLRELREADFVHRSELARIGHAVVAACLRHFRDSCDDWQDRMLSVSDAIDVVLEPPKPPTST